MADESKLVRKTISLPMQLWLEIEAYKASERMLNEAEAIRALLQRGLRGHAADRSL